MIERLFHCRARGSAWTVEVLAGVSTFLALSYIFVVNPSVLGDAGFPRQAVFFATVIASALATLTMGLRTNLPFVLAPGMEINLYVATYVVTAGRLTWQEALGAVFWSGILFFLFTLSGVREGIIDALPVGLRSDLAAAVGVLLVAVALKMAGLLVYDGPHLRGLGIVDRPVLVLAGSAIVVFALAALGVRAAVLISIAAGTLIATLIGMDPRLPAASATDGLFAAVGAADLSVLLRPNGWTIVLVLFLIDFYGSVAKFVGLLRNTELLQDGKLPRLREALMIDGAAAAGGSMLGTTSVLVYAESGVGIAAGGRTGLTAVTAGTAMLLCLAAAPLLAYVPTVATTGALLYVAFRLLPAPAELRKRDGWELVALAGMMAIVVAESALHFAILFGLSLHLARDIFRGVRLNAYAIGSIALLLFGWAVSG
jgi:adenine/guanine/hypoxanthine permease